MNGAPSRKRVRTRSFRACRGGYTLLELIISSSLGAILVGGLSGSLYIASQSLDRSENTIDQAKSHEILAKIMADLNQAIRFSVRANTAVQFTVPDRDGDGLTESITYSWGGGAGTPLVYGYNGSAPVVLAEDVQRFDLSCLTRAVAAAVPAPPNGGDQLLFVVTNESSPTSQETARQTLLESWGYTVNLIEASSSQGNFDTAVGENDVVYVSVDIAAGDVGTKLVSASKGVVNEDKGLIDEFGFATDKSTPSETEVTISKNTHYITSAFSLGAMAISNSSQDMLTVSGTLAPDLQVLGNYGGDAALVALATGAELAAGGSAAGRRVLLPWGNNGFDINQLTDNGQSLLRRAIEWAAGQGDDYPPPELLFVSGQAPDGDGGLGTATAAEQLRIDLINSWGYSTTLISQQENQTDFDSALALADVVFVSGGVNPTTVGTKLNNTTLGVVTESLNNSSTLGIVNGGFYGSITDITIEDTGHYITSEHSTGTLPVVSSAQDLKWIFSGIAPEGETLASVFVGSTYPSLVVVDTGSQLYGGASAAGRRCQLPWGDNGFDFATLNTDGQTLMKRAIDWARGVGSGSGAAAASNVTLEGYADAQLGTNDTSITVAVPSGVSENDLLIAAVVTDGDQSSSLSPPAGWTEILVSSESETRVTLGVWWKLASAAEPSNHTYTWSGNEKAYGWIMRFTGHNQSSPIHVTSTAEGISGSPDSPAVTTTENNCMILRIGGFDDDDVTIGDAGVSGHTTLAANESNDGSGSSSGAAAYAIQATAGDSGTANFTLSNSEEYRTLTIAIEPAGGAVAP